MIVAVGTSEHGRVAFDRCPSCENRAVDHGEPRRRSPWAVVVLASVAILSWVADFVAAALIAPFPSSDSPHPREALAENLARVGSGVVLVLLVVGIAFYSRRRLAAAAVAASMASVTLVLLGIAGALAGSGNCLRNPAATNDCSIPATARDYHVGSVVAGAALAALAVLLGVAATRTRRRTVE